MSIFNTHMPSPNQISRAPEAVSVTGRDLIGSPSDLKGGISIAGVRGNLDVGLEYLESWLRGLGCVPLHNLMEDAATAEIARCQIWQWIKHRSVTNEGQSITKEWIAQMLTDHVADIKKTLGAEAYAARKYELATQLYERMLLSERLEDFLTTVAYPHITTLTKAKL